MTLAAARVRIWHLVDAHDDGDGGSSGAVFITLFQKHKFNTFQY